MSREDLKRKSTGGAREQAWGEGGRVDQGKGCWGHELGGWRQGTAAGDVSWNGVGEGGARGAFRKNKEDEGREKGALERGARGGGAGQGLPDSTHFGQRTFCIAAGNEN